MRTTGHRIFSALDIAIVLTYVAVISIFSAGWLQWNVIFWPLSHDPVVAAFLGNATITTSLSVAAFIAVRPTLHKDLALFQRHPSIALWVPLGVLGVMPFLESLVALMGLATPREPSVNQREIEAILSSVPPTVVAPLLVVVGPLLEEYVFRHVLIGKLSTYIHQWWCAAISIPAFALLHLLGKQELMSWALVPYLATSAALTLCYIVSGHNLLVSYFFHACKNLLAVVIFYWAEAQTS